MQIWYCCCSNTFFSSPEVDEERDKAVVDFPTRGQCFQHFDTVGIVTQNRIVVMSVVIK